MRNFVFYLKLPVTPAQFGQLILLRAAQFARSFAGAGLRLPDPVLQTGPADPEFLGYLGQQFAAEGDPREGAQVAELTGLLTLPGWPEDMRVIVGRERPHPGAQLTLFEARDGWRYTSFVTNTTTGPLQQQEVRHRAHARVEDRIRCTKDTGLRRYPPASSPSTRPGA